MMGAAMTFSAWQRTFGGMWQLIGGVVMLAIAVAAGLLGVWSAAPGPATSSCRSRSLPQLPSRVSPSNG